MAPRHSMNYGGDFTSECAVETRVILADRVNNYDEMSLRELLVASQIDRAVERFGWNTILQLMQEPGAQLTYRDKNNGTVIHNAFGGAESITYIESMLSSYLEDCCENLMDSRGVTYFHIACATSKLEYVIKFLTRSDVDIDTQIPLSSSSFYTGCTPLHIAVEFDRYDIVAFLLKNNANMYLVDVNDMTPLHLAFHDQQINIIDLLMSYERDYKNMIDRFGASHFMAACVGSESHHTERYLLAAVSPITLLSERNRTCSCNLYTPLHFAVKWNRLDVVKILLTYGADCCALGSDGKSPFHVGRLTNLKISNVLKEYCTHDPGCSDLNKVDSENLNYYGICQHCVSHD